MSKFPFRFRDVAEASSSGAVPIHKQENAPKRRGAHQPDEQREVKKPHILFPGRTRELREKKPPDQVSGEIALMP
jgi:hypothetical protein